MSKVAWSLIAGVALAGAAALAQDQSGASSKNLLPNGNFEKGMEGWAITAFGKKGQGAIDDSEKREGRSTLRIDNSEGDDASARQKVAVEPNTHYRLEGYIKTKDVQAVKRGGKDGASLCLSGGWEKTQSVAGTRSWTRVAHDFNTGGETAVEVCARLGYISAPVTGTAWFSDIKLTRIGKAPPRR
jgi:Carbohydrate binding domain